MKSYKSLIIIISLLCFSAYANNENKKENIIFIIVDDLRDLTMADNQLEIMTPNIDKLKKDLFNFRFQKINSQVTNPSKISETKKTIARLKTILKGKINA